MKYFAQLQLIDAKKANLPNTSNNAIQTILTITFVLIGAIALLMLIVAGLRYILARNNPEKIERARNMIMYSLVGLVIAALAATIVNLLIGKAS